MGLLDKLVKIKVAYEAQYDMLMSINEDDEFVDDLHEEYNGAYYSCYFNIDDDLTIPLEKFSNRDFKELGNPSKIRKIRISPDVADDYEVIYNNGSSYYFHAEQLDSEYKWYTDKELISSFEKGDEIDL